MALIQSPSSLTTKPYHHHLPHTPPLLHISTGTHFTVKSQTPSEPSKPAAEATQVPTKPNANPAADKKKGNRAAVIRRSPVEKLLLYSEEDEAKAKEMVGARRCYSSPRPYSRRIGAQLIPTKWENETSKLPESELRGKRGGTLSMANTGIENSTPTLTGIRAIGSLPVATSENELKFEKISRSITRRI
ncbi:hypothetical protein ACFX2B_041241 [Malus domestica]